MFPLITPPEPDKQPGAGLCGCKGQKPGDDQEALEVQWGSCENPFM